MKNLRSLSVLFVVLAVFMVFTACDSTTSGLKTEVAVPTGLAVTAVKEGEALQIVWNKVTGATSYALYYTDDGTAPTKDSTKINLGDVNTYVLANLTGAKSEKDYTFKVSAFNGSKESDLSSASSKIKPIPTIEVRFSGGEDNKNKEMLLIISRIEPEFEGDFHTEDSITYPGFTTDDKGSAVLKAPYDRDYWVGYTLVFDTDESKTLSNGDEVMGYGAATNTWGVSYWKSLRNKSFYCEESYDVTKWHVYSTGD